MKIGLVVQRYGEEILGGAESHARQVAERLATRHEVEVLTSTARDYDTWAPFYAPGESRLNGVAIHRFPIVGERAADFGALSARLFDRPRSLTDEALWLQAQGPRVPRLLDHLAAARSARDVYLFFTYIYYPTVLGLPLVHDRALLVPTAHDEPPLRFGIYRRLFHSPRAILYNTEEERALVERQFGNGYLPNEIVGLGVEVPSAPRPERLLRRLGLSGPYALYLGRIVESKGVQALIEAFRHYRARYGDEAQLLLLGRAEMTLPAMDGLLYGGFVSDEEKFDAMAGATALVVPSQYESLSMIALEAWAMGRPVLCTAASTVVSGMSRRSGGGIPYVGPARFAEALHLLVQQPALARALGEQGRRFVARHYDWPQVMEKYERLLAQVAGLPWG